MNFSLKDELVGLRRLVAGCLGIGFGHKFSALGFAVPATAFVIHAAIKVDPDFAG
jgi:hypothetical protein